MSCDACQTTFQHRFGDDWPATAADLHRLLEVKQQVQHDLGLLEGGAIPGQDEHREELGAALLVMGAYGHSRIRQLIVGRIAPTLLRSMDVPVLVLR